MRDKDVSPGQSVILKATLHTDGGSRGNPGQSGIGFVLEVEGADGERKVRSYGGWYIGHATNNQAEYQALIWGLQNALALRVRMLEVELDSELIVKQLFGEYKVKNESLKPLFAQTVELLSRFYQVEVVHVERALNSDADKLANAAMDAQAPVGRYHVEYALPGLFAGQGEQLGEVTAPAPESAATGAVPAPDDKPNERSATMAKTGTYYLQVKEHFDAAHALIGYDGECKDLHGHTWDVEVEVKGTELDHVGIVYDFKDLKDNLKSILKQFDHKYLNEVPPFDGFNATAENLARVVYGQLAELLPEGISVVEVAVWESPIARLVYKEE